MKHQLKRLIHFSVLLAFFLSASISLFASDTYYSSAEGKIKIALKTELSNIISANYKTYSYKNLYVIYETSDNTADGKVWDMYSTCTWTHGDKRCGNYSSVCDCHNREHSIPQSWFNSSSPMVSDAFHVYPTDGKVNGQRSNYPFGECTNGKSLGGKALGRLGTSTFAGYTGTVFEPDDEYKGDFARTYFYFVTRYQAKMSSFSGASFVKNTYPSLSDWSIDLFLKWHRQDPVSEKEINRNNAVYAYQNNRNPFIDHPELAEYIWGTKMGEVWTLTSGLENNTTKVNVTLQNTVVTNGFLMVQNTEREIVDFRIYDITGLLLLQGTIADQTEINVHELAKGMYLFQTTLSQKQSIQKFMIK